MGLVVAQVCPRLQDRPCNDSGTSESGDSSRALRRGFGRSPAPVDCLGSVLVIPDRSSSVRLECTSKSCRPGQRATMLSMVGEQGYQPAAAALTQVGFSGHPVERLQCPSVSCLGSKEHNKPLRLSVSTGVPGFKARAISASSPSLSKHRLRSTSLSANNECKKASCTEQNTTLTLHLSVSASMPLSTASSAVVARTALWSQFCWLL